MAKTAKRSSSATRDSAKKKPRAPAKPKNPKPSDPPKLDEGALAKERTPIKRAVAGRVVPVHVKPTTLRIKEADAIELLRRTCAKGQMVVNEKTVHLAKWLQQAGYATISQQGPTWRVYPTTAGRQRIREG